MKETMSMRNCLPEKIGNSISEWFIEVRDPSHRLLLESSAMKEFLLSLNSGHKLCRALEVTLKKVGNLHRYTLAQRESASIEILHGDGWRETGERLKNILPDLKEKCKREFRIDKLKETIRCMKNIEKKSVAKVMMYYMDE